MRALLVSSLKLTYNPSFLTEQGHWFCSENYWLCPPTPLLDCCWAAHLPRIVSSPSGQMGLDDILNSGWTCGRRKGLLSISHVGSLVRRSWELPSALAIN